MPRTSKQMIKFLKKNGFVIKGYEGSHCKLYNKKLNKTVIVPYHSRDLKPKTERLILKQAGLLNGGKNNEK